MSVGATWTQRFAELLVLQVHKQCCIVYVFVDDETFHKGRQNFSQILRQDECLVQDSYYRNFVICSGLLHQSIDCCRLWAVTDLTFLIVTTLIRTTKFLQGLKFIVGLSVCYLSKLGVISKNGICWFQKCNVFQSVGRLLVLINQQLINSMFRVEIAIYRTSYTVCNLTMFRHVRM